MQPFTFFISYRRQDTAPIALLLKHEIEKRLQFVRVSVDVEEIKAGEHFPDRLKYLVEHSHATIALIGKQWMARRGTESNIPSAKDWVVHELQHSETVALAMPEVDRFKLKKRFVLPLFADCPRNFEQFDLPSEISHLAQLHAEQIDFASWPSAIGPLIDRIAVKLDLKKRPDADEYPKPDLAKARTQPLADTELFAILRYDDYDGWYIDNFGNSEARYLAKTFKFPHFN